LGAKAGLAEATARREGGDGDRGAGLVGGRTSCCASRRAPGRSARIYKRPERRQPASQELKKKYGEITMLDFPQWTKDTFPGVTHMDIFSGTVRRRDRRQHVHAAAGRRSRHVRSVEPLGRKWLEKLAAKQAATGVKCQHISNNAPTNLASPTTRCARPASTSARSGWTAR
jgi:hypothetical protein